MSTCKAGHPWAGPWKRGMRPTAGYTGNDACTEWLRSCTGGCHYMRLLKPIDPSDAPRSAYHPRSNAPAS